jgi:hypothetical protein
MVFRGRQDGDVLATGGDGTVRLWDAADQAASGNAVFCWPAKPTPCSQLSGVR